MGEPIENHVIPNEQLSLNLDKTHLQKRHRTIGGHARVRTLERLSNKSRKVREFVYKCMYLSTPQSSKCIAILRL